MIKTKLAIALSIPFILTACGGGGVSSADPLSGGTTPTQNNPPQNGSTNAPATQMINANLGIQFVPVSGTSSLNTNLSASGLPVSFTSTTPNVCTVSGNTLTGVAQGTCILNINQAGNSQFAAAAQATAQVPIEDYLLSSITPQLGSTAADPNTMIEGLYTTPNAIGSIPSFALIDHANNFEFGAIFGSLVVNNSNWTFGSNTSVSNPGIYYAVTGSGTFAQKQSLSFTSVAIGGSTGGIYPTLSYDISNAFAASQSSVVGNFTLLTNPTVVDGTGILPTYINNLIISVDAAGNISGTATTSQTVSGKTTQGSCSATGRLIQQEPATHRNMYTLSLTLSGFACSSTPQFTGLAAMYFRPAPVTYNQLPLYQGGLIVSAKSSSNTTISGSTN